MGTELMNNKLSILPQPSAQDHIPANNNAGFIPNTKEEYLLQTVGHANKYAEELHQLYYALLFEAVRKVDIATSARFCSLISELCLMTSISKGRAEKLAGRKYE